MVSSSAIPIFRYCSVVPIVFSNRQKATDVASLDVGQEHDSRCTVQLFDDMFITSTLKSFAEPVVARGVPFAYGDFPTQGAA